MSDTIRRLVHSLLFTPGVGRRRGASTWGINAIFVGGPGSGKTSIVQEIARRAGLHVEVVLASLREPADFLGLPIPVTGEAEREEVMAYVRDGAPRAEPKVRRGRSGGETVTFTGVSFAPPRWAQNLSRAGRAVCFLDEINTPPPAVQAALLRVSQEGWVGELELPAGVRFLAAMNATEDAAGGWDLAPPLANRFLHVAWPAPELAAWASWMTSSDHAEEAAGNASAEEERVLAAWPGAYAGAVGQAHGFLRARPNHFHAQPPSGDPKASSAWPSPRSWEMAVRAVAGARAHGLPEAAQDDLVGAAVGEGVALEFARWRTESDLPTPEAVLDKGGWEPDLKRLDRTVAVLSACAALVVGTKERQKERARALWRIIGLLSEDRVDAKGRKIPTARDLAVDPAVALFRANLREGATKEVMAPLWSVMDAIQRGR